MNLLEDIQKSAVDPNCDLATLLRKCRVLANQLKSRPLENWVLLESDGYPNSIEVPTYRIFPISLKGSFSDPYGSINVNNINIPIGAVPEDIREKFSRHECRESIAGIERLLSNSKDNGIHIDLGPISGYLGKNTLQGMQCLHAWGEIPTGAVIELLNTVRNRILNFSLEVFKEYPNAGEFGINKEASIAASRVTQVFNTTIRGGMTNIVGSANHSHIVFQNTPFDFESLRKILLENNAQESDIQELKGALDNDPKSESPGAFGIHVSDWIGKMVTKAANGAWNITIASAGNLLASVISKYYGF